MAELVSVNVGLPKDVPWQHRTVHTGIWKTPVDGPVMARTLNLDGDGQGDLGGHGGPNRAVLVYQVESYDHWATVLNRDDLRPGHFGENFTVSGLADDEVCIGDRLRIGDAEFEVTQPRVTCFRIGLRLGVPEMPNLLVAHHRPGFYLRVLREGHVRAGDTIAVTARGPHRLSVAEVDALLYLPGRDDDRMRDALDVPALSPGWQGSFRELLDAPAGTDTVPPTPVGPAWSGFRPLRVAGVHTETPEVMSVRLQALDGSALPAPRPGQYLTIRVAAADPAPVRNYSVSDADATSYRISVKREPRGLVSTWLHGRLRAGATVDVAAPRGDFQLVEGTGPVLLVSAGIGVTPVLAMLRALADHPREVWWIHTTRDATTHAFKAEVEQLLGRLPHGHRHIRYTGSDGRLDARAVAALGLPADADAYVCGPTAFMRDVGDLLTDAGVDPARIHTETFGTLTAVNPGVVGAEHPAPHPPPGAPGDGPAVTFARSAITVDWSNGYDSLLDFAEACDVPTRFSCRSGVCHVCTTRILDGAVTYAAPPLDPPPDGDVLVCSAVPDGPVILDL